jgi:DNA invertase Pin-like site-specific DNA recombinase
MAQKVLFVVAELGLDVDPFMLHIYAAVAEKERALISQRTREALAAVRTRGVKLGNPKIGDVAAAGRGKRTATANERAANVLPVIDAIRNAGVITLSGIAETLNTRGLKTARGNAWSATEVSRTLARR